jgi:hypothetical protein
MKIEQKLYESIKVLPKEKKKQASKLIEKINKLKNKLQMKKRSVEFDKRYNPKGVFSESNLRYDKMKQDVIELEDKLKCVIHDLNEEVKE